MPSDRFARVKELLLEVLDLPAEERRAFLDKSCRDDPSLRAEAESILAHDDDEIRTFAASGILPAGNYELSKEIAGYRLLESLGEGGMGDVYLAEQTEPVRRRVALKVIKAGMDTRQVVARFEAERQALAMMDHPNVAKVFDAGATEDGRPFFVMEYVPGERITAYCDRHQLPTRDRLELFIQVCEAVHHAHQRGIIHRDLKPMNILVEEIDGRAISKVIDFGIAKATAQPLTERTLFTERGQLVGTPEYMSPEQAESGAIDIDTRSDIYSLGVVLYELLVGSLPFDSKSLREAGYAGIQRVLREQDPPRPSTRIQTPGPDTETVIRNRHTDRPTLLGQLRGDLDWVTMKALEKNRTRRYASASEFAADIARHLNDEPVLARPPSAGYQLRKLVARHKTPFAFAASIVVLLAASAVTMFVMYHNQRREAERAEAASTFLKEMLSSVSLEETQGQEVTMEYILGEAARRLETELAGEPEIQAELHMALSGAYASFDLHDQAESHCRAALAIRRELHGNEHADIAASLEAMGQILHNETDHEGAESWVREALAMRRRLLGGEHEDVAESMRTLGDLLGHRAVYDSAEVLLREALSIQRVRLGGEHEEVVRTLLELTEVLKSRGDLEAAKPLAREAVEVATRLYGDHHPLTLDAMYRLSAVLQMSGDLDGAAGIVTEALPRCRELYGDRHENVAQLLTELANLHRARGDHAASEPLYREALSIYRDAYGERHQYVGICNNNLANALTGLGRYEEAEQSYREAISIEREVLGAKHRIIASPLNGLAANFMKQGRYGKAEPLQREAIEILEGAGVTGWMLAENQSRLGACLAELRRYEEAESYLLQADPVVQEAKCQIKYKRWSLERLVALYEGWGKPDRATEYQTKLDSLNAGA